MSERSALARGGRCARSSCLTWRPGGRADEALSAARPDAAADVAAERALALLEEALRQARRAHVPLLVSRLAPAGGAPAGGGGGGADHARCLVAEASLLDALQPHVIDPAARPVLPPDIFSTHDAADGPAAAHQPAGAAAAGAAVGGAGGGAAAPAGASAPRRGRPPMPLPADLLPALAAFLLAHPELRAVAKVAQASSRAPAFAPSRWREQSLDLCGSPGCAALCVLARQGALGSSLRSLRRLMRSLRCRRSARRTRSAS